MTQGPAMKARGAPPPRATRASIATRRVVPPGSAGGGAVPLAGIDEAPEQGVRRHRLRLELGVELAGEEVRVPRDLDDFDEALVGGLARDLEPAPLEIVHVLAVDLIAVPVTLADLGPPVRLVRRRPRLEEAGPLPEPHVAPHPLDAVELPELVDHRVRRLR